MVVGQRKLGENDLERGGRIVFQRPDFIVFECRVEPEEPEQRGEPGQPENEEAEPLFPAVHRSPAA